MENNSSPYQRKSSTSRSNIIENCIKTLEDATRVNSFDLEEFELLVVNNTLPAELRFTAWRLFLGILPNDKNRLEWVNITREERLKFEKLNSEKDIETYVKVIRKEAEESSLPDNPLSKAYNLIINELIKISAHYDFFKSQIVAETLIRLYLIWTNQNNEFITMNDFSKIQIFYILAGVIYILYPSILHLQTEINEIEKLEDIDSRTLFYFLNDEEYFDADVYILFNHLLNKTGLKENLKNYYSDDLSTNEIALKEITCIDIEDLSSYDTKKLNKVPIFSYLLLKIINPSLYDHLATIKFDTYQIIRLWSASFLASSFTFEHLAYFWDNIFINSTVGTLDFLEFVIVALINNLSQELSNADEATVKSLLMTYPENNLNGKDVIKRTFKLKEKLSDKLN